VTFGPVRFQRYAIYFTPPPGPLADFGASWLGWDIAAGTACRQFDLPGVPLAALTAVPRPYGFHATLKPPFRLPGHQSFPALSRTVEAMARALKPVTAGPLEPARIGRFLALVPGGDQTGLKALAAEVLQGFDAFRAQPTEAEIDRRRVAGLTPRQSALLVRWGYPYVLDEFRFHLTLTGPLGDQDCATARIVLAPLLAPFIGKRFILDALTLAGADENGRFHEIQRVPLAEGNPGV
jgi:hypothetical protein